MNCAVHPEAEATGFCRNCGKAMCPQCVRSVQGVLYCEPCLATLVATPQQPAPGAGSPAVAAILGFVPGLGAVYNGEYLKALIHICIFAGLIALLNSDRPDSYMVFYSLLLAAFVLYMPIEAYRTAQARMLGRQAASVAAASGSTPAAPGTPGAVGTPDAAFTNVVPGVARRSHWLTGPVVLIGLGLLFLLSNFGWVRAYWLEDFWPVLLIALGAWMLWKRSRSASS